MESIKIVLLCVGAAIVYGIGHDHITARISLEYFTIGHPPILGGTQDPSLLAFGWGVIATWWVGVMLGVPAAVLARAGSRPKFGWRDLRVAIAVLMGVVAISAVVGGLVGYATGGLVANASWFHEQGIHGNRIIRFTTAAGAHQAAYGAGFIGGILTWGWIWWRRGRAERRALLTELERLRRENEELMKHRSV
jgi:hypothetical protein